MLKLKLNILVLEIFPRFYNLSFISANDLHPEMCGVCDKKLVSSNLNKIAFNTNQRNNVYNNDNIINLLYLQKLYLTNLTRYYYYFYLICVLFLAMAKGPTS